jgi:hypothetical protein
MALRLRRGTDAERLLITPFAGEPIFTTDTKQLFIGDGATLGGVPIDTTIGGSLSTLTDVDLTSLAPIANNLLSYNGSKWVVQTGAIISNLNGNVFGDVNGDLEGNVFSNDSTLLVDGVNGKIVGDIITANVQIEADGNEIKLLTISSNIVGSSGCNDIDFVSYGGTALAPTDLVAGNGVIDIIAKGWHTGDSRGIASMRFRTDPLGTFNNPSVGMPGSILFSTFNDDGIQPLLNFMELDSQGRLNVGGASVSNPSLPGKVRVVGGVTSTSFMRPGSLTTVERDELTPDVGMIIYNTTTNTFQGYQNTSGTTLEWVNLS